MTFEEIKKRFHSNIQIIQIDINGIITASDDILFKAPLKSNIEDLNSFFEVAIHLLPTIKEEFTLPSVNVAIEDSKFIFDVNIINNQDHFIFVLYDFTNQYAIAQRTVQERNETTIKKYRLSTDKNILLLKEDYKNKFLAHINHEIRNPLNNMMGILEILKETRMDKNQEEMTKIVTQIGLHIQLLMEDLLDISKIEKGELTLRTIPFFIRSILTKIHNQFTQRYRKKGITLELNIGPLKEPKLMGDPVRLSQILNNLLENALRNTHEGNVSIAVSQNIDTDDEDNSSIIIEVTDTGIGFSEEELPQIFDNYYQIEHRRATPLGEGLGLKIVDELATLSGGYIKASSKINEGSTFTLTIPYKVARKQPKKPRIKKLKTRGIGLIKKRQFLLVDNDEVSQLILAKHFANEDEYFVHFATNGEKALQLIEEHTYDFIIMTMNLPKIDGFKLLSLIRGHENDSIKNLPILVHTGATMATEIQNIKDAGVNAILEKPYTFKHLMFEIDKLFLQ